MIIKLLILVAAIFVIYRFSLFVRYMYFAAKRQIQTNVDSINDQLKAFYKAENIDLTVKQESYFLKTVDRITPQKKGFYTNNNFPLKEAWEITKKKYGL